MLLFMMETQFHQTLTRSFRMSEQRFHCGVHMAAIGVDCFQWRPREQAALGPWLPLADGVVVAIEEVAEGRIELRVPREIWFQEEGFEEPSGVR